MFSDKSKKNKNDQQKYLISLPRNKTDIEILIGGQRVRTEQNVSKNWLCKALARPFQNALSEGLVNSDV